MIYWSTSSSLSTVLVVLLVIPKADVVFFGCAHPSVHDYVGVFLTDAEDNIIVPAAPIYYLTGYSFGKGWYRVHGFKNGATEVTLSTGNSAFEIKSGQMLRLWYGEDLVKEAESNNS